MHSVIGAISSSERGEGGFATGQTQVVKLGKLITQTLRDNIQRVLHICFD